MTGVIRRSGSKAYLGALMVAQASALIRYVVLARLLGPEQLGLAAIVVLTAQFFDAITDAGNDRFLIQDREGGTAGALRLVQLVAAARAVLIAIGIVLLATPIAKLAGAPDVSSSLRYLAIVALATGLTNYSFRAAQRDHKFAPESRILFVSELSGLLATVIAAYVIGNYTAVLYGLATRAAAAAAMSHLVASRRYSLGYSGELARRLWKFGAPLIVTGLLLFISVQSDRIIISRTLGLAELGRYSAMLLLLLYPTSMMMRFVGALYLPIIAGAPDNRARRSPVNLLGGYTLLLAIGIAASFALLAPFLLPLVFGEAYRQEATASSMIGILMALRFMKLAPTTAALALGRSSVLLVNNALRVSAIPAAFAGLAIIGGLEGIIAGLILAELVANVTATLMVNRFAGWPTTRELDRYALFVAVGAATIGWGIASDHSSASQEGLTLLLLLALLAVSAWRERGTIRELRSFALRRLVQFAPVARWIS